MKEKNFEKITFKDCVGINTTGEIISNNTTYYTLSRLYTIEEIQQLEQQLQAYKDKEDKLREHCKSGISELNYEIKDWLDDSQTENKDVIEDLKIQKQIFKDILQILNEGSDIDA